MDAQKRPGWELLIVVIVFVVAGVLLGMGYKQQGKLEKERALHYQLQVLRTAELLYESVNKAKPESLTQLSEGRFQAEADGPKHLYIDPPPVLIGGKAVDPFGNPYAYDARTGRIKSTTQGFGSW
ncbi:MAG: hypothetical protein V2A66_07440 [Pseudomonadota bacterium]